MATNSRKHQVCSECVGTDIIMNISVSQTAVSGEIGLAFKSLAVLTATAPMFADLCRKCGTIVRLYVRDTDKPWVQH